MKVPYIIFALACLIVLVIHYFVDLSKLSQVTTPTLILISIPLGVVSMCALMFMDDE